MKTFYRVANNETQQGLWYDFNGNFTGLIHETFNFCKNSSLSMPFDSEISGWLSATETLDELYNWFPKEDLIKLEKQGYFITVYQASDFKKSHNHWIISQETSLVVEQQKVIIYTN